MKHLNPKIYMWILIGISILIYLGYVKLLPLVENPHFLDYLKPIPFVVGFDVVLVLIFSQWLWKFKLFYPWLVPFPILNGTWKGEIISSWIDDETGTPPKPIPTILTIKQSFTNISCVIRTQENKSFSFLSGFVLDKENQIYQLVYSYHSIPNLPIRDRSPEHNGTGIFDILISDDKNKELVGEYWTARQTKGVVKLKFWKKEQLSKYPEELGEHPVSEVRNDK